jgi:hypothetical protein
VLVLDEGVAAGLACDGGGVGVGAEGT